MTLPALLNTPRNAEDWEIWAFNHAQDHLEIIRRIRYLTGNVASATILNGGAGYTSIPTITLDPNGSGASFQLSFKSGVLSSVNLSSGGRGYQSAFFTLNGGGYSTQAEVQIVVNPVVSLQDYQLYPIDPNNFPEFLWRHERMHTEMDGVLDIPSVDLSSLDPRDASKLQAWIYSNYQEHDNVYNKLGI
jgi:hypothetical protein